MTIAHSPSLPVIASLWYGSNLSWLETLCITSYLEHGHRFILYTTEALTGIPEGTEIRHASEILWPAPFEIVDNDRLRVAVFSDLFRLRLLQKEDCIWVDLDAYCVRPFAFDSPYVFSKAADGTFPTGVIGLPKTSQTLERMLHFCTAPNPSQPWRGPRLHKTNERRIERGETWGIEELPWGCSGPKAFTHFLLQSGEDQYALPNQTLYPFAIPDLWKLHAPYVSTRAIERKGVYSVHIYGSQKKKIATTMSGVPHADSYLDRLCQRHHIDPHQQKITPLAWM